MKQYNGREWKWWLVGNGHFCKFCYEKYGAEYARNNPQSKLGKQALDKRDGRGQYTRGYWNTLYRVWLNHVKNYHPEVLNK